MKEKCCSFALSQLQRVSKCLTRVSTVVCLTMFSSLCWWFLVGWGPALIFFSSRFYDIKRFRTKLVTHRTTLRPPETKDAAKWAPHRYRVPLQHQLLGSPHLLLLHLPADRLFGLVGQLTARRQAWIPDHLFDPPEKERRLKLSCKNAPLSPLFRSRANTGVDGETQKKRKRPGFFGAIVRVLWHKTPNLFSPLKP